MAQRVVYLDDNEIVTLDPAGMHVATIDAAPVEKEVQLLEMTLEQIELAGFEHHMLKEIFEQPETLRNTMRGRVNVQTGEITLGGLKACERELKDLRRLEFFEAGRSFHIGDVAVMPFTIPHDAADPVGFTFQVEGVKLGFATDLGYMPASVREHLRACDGLIIESNHDLEMLRSGPYPWSVKQRVMSRVGHLSNEALAEFLTGDYDGGAAFLVLAHLSEQNNNPEIARVAAERALGERPSLFQQELRLASQSQPLAAITL